MCNVRYATEDDKAFWYSLDKELPIQEFTLKLRDKRGYVILDGDKRVGIMRYNLMWDTIPFLTLIILDVAYLGQNFGTDAMIYWENEMRSLKYEMVMTSTRVDEQAQHFYRKLGYVDKGSLFLDNTPLAQPQELFMIKIL